MLYRKPCRGLRERDCAAVRAKEIAEDISCLHTEKYTGAQVCFLLIIKWAQLLNCNTAAAQK